MHPLTSFLIPVASACVQETRNCAQSPREQGAGCDLRKASLFPKRTKRRERGCIRNNPSIDSAAPNVQPGGPALPVGRPTAHPLKAGNPRPIPIRRPRAGQRCCDPLACRAHERAGGGTRSARDRRESGARVGRAGLSGACPRARLERLACRAVKRFAGLAGFAVGPAVPRELQCCTVTRRGSLPHACAEQRRAVHGNKPAHTRTCRCCSVRALPGRFCFARDGTRDGADRGTASPTSPIEQAKILHQHTQPRRQPRQEQKKN